jgi:hypothetical protein
MRFCVVILLVVSTLTLPVRGLVKAAGEIFSLLIRPLQETVNAGSDVELMIKLTNNTNYDITFVSTNQYCDYAVEVEDGNGQSAPETEQKRKLKCAEHPVAGKVITVRLKPGEYHEDLLVLNQLFDMTRPDKYTVQVTREIPKELGKGHVKSKRIGITVTE